MSTSKPLVGQLLDELRSCVKPLSADFDDVLLYGSIPNGNASSDPADASDFDLLCIWKMTCERTPLERMASLRRLRTAEAQFREAQQRVTKSQWVFPTSYAILCPLECYYNILKDDDTQSFFVLEQQGRYSLLTERIVKLSDLKQEDVPADQQFLEKVLEQVQRQRRAYVLTPPEQDHESQIAHGGELKKLFRKTALLASGLKKTSPATDLQYGLTNLKHFAQDYFNQLHTDNTASWIQPKARLDGTICRSDWQLTNDDCMLFWELLAQKCYDELHQLATRPQRCEAALREICDRTVATWNMYANEGDQKEGPLRYLANGMSVRVKSDNLQQLLEDSGISRAAAKTAAEAQKQTYQSICDPHEGENAIFNALFRWQPVTDSANRPGGEQELCKCHDEPGTNGLRLLVTEDAGTGKSVFLRRFQAWLSDGNRKVNPFHQQLPLVLRWQSDGDDEMAWPTPEKQGQYRDFLREAIRKAIQIQYQRILGQHQITAEDFLDHLWATPHRIVLLMDAFDQLVDPNVELRRRLLTAFEPRPTSDVGGQPDSLWNRVHVVVTSRRIAVKDEIQIQGLFCSRVWVTCSLDPWTARQQVAYLEAVLQRTHPDTDLVGISKNESHAGEFLQEKVFAGLTDEAESLLKVPLLLKMVRQLAEDPASNNAFPKFRNRADLYRQVTMHLLDIETLKAKIRDRGQTYSIGSADLPGDIEACLSIVALEMMLTAAGRWVVKDQSKTTLMSEASGRAAREGQRDWSKLETVLPFLTICSHFLITENVTRQLFAWKHREMMEYFTALFLVKYGQEKWSTQDPATNSWTCTEERLVRAVGNPQWDSTWRFALELMELPENSRSGAWDPSHRSRAASFSTLFGEPDAASGFCRPTELMWRCLELAKRRNWVEFAHWKAKLQAQFQKKLNDPNTVRVAAQLVPFEVLKKSWAESKQRSQQLAAIAPDPQHPDWVPCPPYTWKGAPETAMSRWLHKINRWLLKRKDHQKTEYFWFRQGSAPNVGYGDERPRHWWRVKRFWMQATAVTVEQFLLFDPGHRQEYQKEFDQYAREHDCPVIEVSWYDAAMFAVWVGDQCRLPTESEWEFACRAGHDKEGDQYSLADGSLRDISPKHANYGNKVGETLPVRWDANRRDSWRSKNDSEGPPGYLPNQWRLWQMHGNVWEWCADLRDPKKYDGRVSRNPELANVAGDSPPGFEPNPEHDQMFTVGPSRVLRGGSWFDHGDRLRCAFRLDVGPVNRNLIIGFRLCWES